MTVPTAVWVPKAPLHGVLPLSDQLHALHTATEASHLVLPVTPHRDLPHTWTPKPYALVLDLTYRLTQQRRRRLTGDGLTLVHTYCRLLKPRAVLIEPHPELDLHHLPTLPTVTDWWVLGALDRRHPHQTVLDLAREIAFPATVTPVAALIRTASGLPYMTDPDRVRTLVQLAYAFPGLLPLLPPDETPYQMRTALELLKVRAAL